MFDEFYTKLEQGRIEPITFWESHVSTWDFLKQEQFCIRLLGIATKEEREGHYGSNLHRYALYLYEYLSREINFQQQRKRNQSDVESSQLPEILKNPDIRNDFDKAIQIGLLEDYCTLKASKMLLACFCWGICKQYDKGTKAKSGENKGGFAADWSKFDFIKDGNGKDIDLRQSWQNAKHKNMERNEKTGKVKFNPDKLSVFPFWKHLCNELGISE